MIIVETISRTVANDMDGQFYIEKWKEKYDRDGQVYKVKETTMGITIMVTRWLDVGNELVTGGGQ